MITLILIILLTHSGAISLGWGIGLACFWIFEVLVRIAARMAGY